VADGPIKKKVFFTQLFIMEFLALIVCPIPGVNPTIEMQGGAFNYSLHEFILAFMWIRIFFLVRSIFNYSIYTDAFSKKLC